MKTVKCCIPKCPASITTPGPRLAEKDKWIVIDHIGPMCPFHGKTFMVGVASPAFAVACEVAS
jgi:hypothetical protein